jgi:hypothetical protein
MMARGAIVEKGQERRKVIGDYLNNTNAPYNRRSELASRSFDLYKIASKLAPTVEGGVGYFFLAGALALTLR